MALPWALAALAIPLFYDFSRYAVGVVLGRNRLAGQSCHLSPNMLQSLRLALDFAWLSRIYMANQ
ncbi:hypothetical protein [Moraxella bovoculi]|uniref:hypothetical protein n=1 Tax=Moraxella bovoculi TaxID=386891 RepID=UPI0012D4C321|nr:hypothetical protein [Moraxella bovoculi]